MKKVKRWVLLAAAAFLAAACDPLTTTAQGKEVQGAYVLPTDSGFGPWTEKYTVSETGVRYESGVNENEMSVVYAGTIVKTVFNRFNSGEIRPAQNIGEETVFKNFGYMILKYTECDNEGTGQPGQFNIFRFAEKEDGTWIFTQGFKNGSGKEGVYINSLCGTAAKAEREVTEKNGYFDFASTGFLKK